MKRQPMKELVLGMIQKRKEVIRQQAERYRRIAESNESYWGLGGPVMRQHRAADRREAELEELEEFERQVRRSVETEKILVYVMGCRDCNGIILTTIEPTEGWHECPICRKMMYTSRINSETMEVVKQGQPWMHALRKEIEE